MLETVSQLAARLRPLQQTLLAILGVLVVGTLLSLFMPKVGVLQAALPTLIALLLWVVCALVFILAFASVPAPPTPALRGLARLARLLNRGLHWLLLGAFALITVAVILLSARLIADV
jgi:hypothetical protein